MGKDFRFKRLRRHQVGRSGRNMKLSIPAPQTPSGKVYRSCPREECVPGLFVLGQPSGAADQGRAEASRVRRPSGVGGTTCPYCGHDGPDDDFVYDRDVAAITKYIEWAVTQDVGDYMDGIVSDFNRSMKRSGGGPFDISMRVQRKPRGSKPFVWREDLLRDMTCHCCGTPYGVYATALFCPDCGHPNLANHFDRELALIEQQLLLADQVQNDGNNELAYRLLGNAHEDVLTAFEAFQKVTYRYLVCSRLPDQVAELTMKSAIGNRFQNIQRGQRLWSNFSLDPFNGLSEDQVATLRINIEKRHVIGHNLSVVDEAYATAAESEEPGKTIRLLGDEIQRFATICKAVVDKLDEYLP